MLNWGLKLVLINLKPSYDLCLRFQFYGEKAFGQFTVTKV